MKHTQFHWLVLVVIRAEEHLCSISLAKACYVLSLRLLAL